MDAQLDLGWDLHSRKGKKAAGARSHTRRGHGRSHMNGPRILDNRRTTMATRRLVAVAFATPLSLGSSTSFLPLPLAGLPYSPNGMRHADAKPNKDCIVRTTGKK